MHARRRRRFSLTWLLVGLFVASLLVGIAVYRPFAVKAGTATGGADVDPVPPPEKLPGERITFLLMGVDKRQGDVGRADSMVVVSYDTASQQLALLSLARDTWAQIPGHGYDKINHAYAFGGEQLAIQTVQRLLGVPIDHYVTINFKGFAQIVDALGGVDIEAEKRMFYHDPTYDPDWPDGLLIDIQAGAQHMDGLTALKYARYRADDEGDVGRMRRQQQVAEAMMQTAATPSVIARIPQLIPAVAAALETDLSVAEMVKLGSGGREALSHPLRTGALTGEGRTIGGVFYFVPDLVRERATAYELLVGSAPPAEFMSRAREDGEAYAKALADASDEGSLTPTDSSGTPPIVGTTPGTNPPDTNPSGTNPPGTNPSGTNPPGTNPPGTNPPGTSPPGTNPSGTNPPGTNPPGTNPPGTNPPGTKPPATTKPQPLTIAVIDASGHDLGPAYVRKLKAAGFRVARVGKASKPVPRTVAMDHALRAGTEAKIKAVLPNAMVVPAKDSQAGEAVEIILGADLVKSEN